MNNGISDGGFRFLSKFRNSYNFELYFSNSKKNTILHVLLKIKSENQPKLIYIHKSASKWDGDWSHIGTGSEAKDGDATSND
jgi:hypothetical protein